MGVTLHPYVNVRGICQAAMGFYRSVLGGEVTVPLAQQMWGAEFGMITDRFGVRWMVNIGG